MLGAVVPQLAQQRVDLGHGRGGEPVQDGGADELMEPQAITGGVDERVCGQRVPGEPVAGQMKGGGELPEDLVVEDPRRAQYLQRADFLGSHVLEEAREDLVLGDKGAVDVAAGPLMGVDGQVQVEGEALRLRQR